MTDPSPAVVGHGVKSMWWFGSAWATSGQRAGVCEPDRQEPPPVGIECVGCELRVRAVDRGVVLPVETPLGVIEETWHLRCLLAYLIGDELATRIGGVLTVEPPEPGRPTVAYATSDPAVRQLAVGRPWPDGEPS